MAAPRPTGDLRRYKAVARGFGCDAVAAQGAYEVEAALIDALRVRRPRLIQLAIRNERQPRDRAKMVQSPRKAAGN